VLFGALGVGRLYLLRARARAGGGR
jgi:hypothetical protein